MRISGALAGPPISGIIKQNNSTFQDVAMYAGTQLIRPFKNQRPISFTGTITLASVAVMLASKYFAIKELVTGKF